MPTLRLLPPVPRHPEVIRIRDRKRKPFSERIAEAAPAFATLEDVGGWEGLSESLFGDDRMVPEKPKRVGNVIQMPLPRRRSTALEIEQVRQEEERRGKRR